MLTKLNLPKFFATKLTGGVTKNKKNSAGRRLGVKKFHGEACKISQILVR